MRKKLIDRTTQECLALIAAIEANPKNQNPPGSFWKYTAAARAKIDKLMREIRSNMRAEKIARGEPVNDEGYSGRQSNRR